MTPLVIYALGGGNTVIQIHKHRLATVTVLVNFYNKQLQQAILRACTLFTLWLHISASS